MITVTISDGSGLTVAEGRARTTEPVEAIRRVGKRLLGWPHIGLMQRFPGGDTYHVQFGRPARGGGVDLSDRYVVHATLRRC